MQVDTGTIEKMAREYNQVLSNYDISDNATNIIERLIMLSEDQLDIINCMLCQPQIRYCSKILNYLKTLITSAIIALNRLLNRGEYIPPFRNPRCNQSYSAAFMRLVELQLDIFVLLDKLAPLRSDITNVLILENRVMAVISVVCR
ncbi:MAG: hypothetical protein PHC84_02315 [Clostridia bacterium]|nr:hypothetical protein [Clostridia bacterium]